MGELDTMIAAHALTLAVTLVTNDGHFSHVAGLQLEDWL
jgi:predicted nucleic acid-binding protein